MVESVSPPYPIPYTVSYLSKWLPPNTSRRSLLSICICDPRSPFVTSGVRIGTPAITTRGLKEEDMPKIAECIWLAATDFENQADYIKGEVTKLCDKYPIYK